MVVKGVAGGAHLVGQKMELLRGAAVCDMLVATPGRLMALVERKVINLSRVGCLVSWGEGVGEMEAKLGFGGGKGVV